MTRTYDTIRLAWHSTMTRPMQIFVGGILLVDAFWSVFDRRAIWFMFVGLGARFLYELWAAKSSSSSILELTEALNVDGTVRHLAPYSEGSFARYRTARAREQISARTTPISSMSSSSNRGKTPGTQLQHGASLPPAPAEMRGFGGPIGRREHNLP
jgi:hypothetical protein